MVNSLYPVGRSDLSQQSIECRRGIWKGYVVHQLQSKIGLLDQKIQHHAFFYERYRRASLCIKISLAAGIAGVIGGGSATALGCSNEEKSICEAGIVTLAIGTAFASVPSVLFAYHKYQLKKSNLPIWKEKKEALEKFRQKILENDFSYDLLKGLFLHPKLPFSFKQKIALDASLDQLFIVAACASASEREILYSLFDPKDVASISMLLNPSQYDQRDIARFLKVKHSFLMNHPSIFLYMHKRLDSHLNDEKVKRAIRMIGIDQNKLGIKYIRVHVGAATRNISQRMLKKFPLFAAAFKNSYDTSTDSDSVEEIALIGDRNYQDDFDLEFRLKKNQDPAPILAVLEYFNTRKLPENIDLTEFLNVALQYNIEPLIYECVKKLLNEMSMDLPIVEKANAYAKLIQILLPEFLPKMLVQAVENECLAAANRGDWGETAFWLDFAKENSKDLFHHFTLLPRELSSEYISLIFSKKPRGLIKALRDLHTS